MVEKCSVCGAPMENGKCTYCGATIHNEVEEMRVQDNLQSSMSVNTNNPRNKETNVIYCKMVSPKEKIVALILCIFGGYLGLHKFYVGKIGSGIIYLFTGGIFGIGWIIDILTILCGTFKDSKGLPLK